MTGEQKDYIGLGSVTNCLQAHARANSDVPNFRMEAENVSTAIARLAEIGGGQSALEAVACSILNKQFVKSGRLFRIGDSGSCFTCNYYSSGAERDFVGELIQ